MSRKSVADEAKAVVRRNTAEVQGKGRFEVFEELFADDFVDHTTQPGTGMTPDKAGVRKLYASLREAFPDFHAEIHWQLADGDRVTTYKTYYGTHDGPFLGIAPTHHRIHFESVDVMRVQDGKITDHWGVGNLLSLMQQIGWTPASVAASCDAEHERIAQERIAEDETAIRAASEGWSKAAQSKDLEKSLSFSPMPPFCCRRKAPQSKARSTSARCGSRCWRFRGLA